MKKKERQLVEDIGRMTLHGPLPMKTVMQLHAVAVTAIAERDALAAKVAELEEKAQVAEDRMLRAIEQAKVRGMKLALVQQAFDEMCDAPQVLQAGVIAVMRSWINRFQAILNEDEPAPPKEEP